MAPSLGNRIRTARDAAGLTREEVAARIGVNWRTLARYESGETKRISYETLVEIAVATGKPISYFLPKKRAVA